MCASRFRTYLRGRCVEHHFTQILYWWLSRRRKIRGKRVRRGTVKQEFLLNITLYMGQRRWYSLPKWEKIQEDFVMLMQVNHICEITTCEITTCEITTSWCSISHVDHM